ncbi:hypothetical protein SAMN05192534_101442 [Alteribacillus persepolensis]|uniref:Uncharacterized protein n=1 Tax=Alteribacillus persepolensis TaxID=568899 RepID=A0A1G7Z8I9_9BACI|nr:hypothetical protein [Alteribacillus persepolensis]SDH04919.1 hypothetical protein SAMN05192534_101442 [Alteribacillus persepolensis]
MNRIHMDKKTISWIKKNGGIVTLHPFYPFSEKKQRGLVDVLLTFDKPDDDSCFEAIPFEGVHIYIHQDLHIKNQLKIRISGFGPFQHLSCSGIKHFRKRTAV